MDSDGEGSDGRTTARAEDEFELPRVMWVPDSMGDQEDFFRKTRKGESIVHRYFVHFCSDARFLLLKR